MNNAHFDEHGEFEVLLARGEERHRHTRPIELVGPGFYANIAAALNAGAPLNVTAEQALDVIRVLAAANRSAETGDAVALA